ncbi:hypothetical protein HDR63_02820 [bacterium]|nr:hypothetical protein [bacterium]
MRKFLPFLFGCLMGISVADAASVRGAGVTVAANRDAAPARTTAATSARGAATSVTERTTTSPARTAQSVSTVTPRGATTTTGTSVAARSATARAATSPASTARASATIAANASARGRAATPSVHTVRSALGVLSATASRAATTSAASRARAATATNTFDAGYNACRDAYFACMDQFCALQNESYRRCVCSSRLTDIQNQERLLSQTAEQLQDFKDLNISAITKSAAEVKAMLTATEGEAVAASAKDDSASAGALAGISDVLNKTKKQSLSTQGTLDIAGDIKALWNNSDIAASASLATLTGEALYNAVHAQCAELVADACPTTATFNMVVSAYGMYIENDCTTLANNLNNKTYTASGTVRDTEREMNLARLENYNAHNSSSINECIANVRADITGNMACGENYVHCLDVSGLYLNRDTGEPIYTTDFYMLGSQLSLSGDVLTNETNTLVVAELNRKKSFAQKSLDTCRDLEADVWDEFLRQAIAEIYQGQQERIRQVKDECMDVVNKCYDEQNKQLKDFSNIKESLLLGSRLELSEQMCQEKLDACSNLYGGGPGGLDLLVATMGGITEQKIAQECQSLLRDFATDMCKTPANDTNHAYPYNCRTYKPGNGTYARVGACNSTVDSTTDQQSSSVAASPAMFLAAAVGAAAVQIDSPYVCPTSVTKIYTSCVQGYYLGCPAGGIAGICSETDTTTTTTDEAGNSTTQLLDETYRTQCYKCESNMNCPGGSAPPQWNGAITTKCPDTNNEYVGSLYHKLVRYALQVCIRPSAAETGMSVPPDVILQDVNVVMDSIRADMAKQLASECDRRGGVWVSQPYQTGGTPQLKLFYDKTGASTEWGYCAEKEDTE